MPEDTVFARISLLAGWQGAAHMRRNRDVPSVECAKDGIAFDQNNPWVLLFSFNLKRIAM
ncbi:hypothetical protein [Desulfosporosinus sp. OT]|uniref:hypothetical protein n=1 Tax=Desulfosporosinus sp. OT TaxID=913865 RepID=UPI001A98FDE0|nr:hypothetical protein [Desulfosporosinus sp. OT]